MPANSSAQTLASYADPKSSIDDFEKMSFTLYPLEHWSTDRVGSKIPADRRSWRGMTEQRHRQLQVLIATFRVVVPLVINRRTDRLIDGIERFTVLESLGYQEIPIVTVDLDERDEVALAIALNTEYGDWIDSRLVEQVAALAQTDAIHFTGLDETEIFEIISRLPKPPPPPKSPTPVQQQIFPPTTLEDEEPEEGSVPFQSVVIPQTSATKGGHSTPRYRQFVCPDGFFTCPEAEYQALLHSLEGESITEKTRSLKQLLWLGITEENTHD